LASIPDDTTNPEFAAAKTRIDARIDDLRRQVEEGRQVLPPRPARKERKSPRAESVVIAGSAWYVPALVVVLWLVSNTAIRLPAELLPILLLLIPVTSMIAAVGGGVLYWRRQQGRWLAASLWGITLCGIMLWFIINPVHMVC
jgi:uncharacterized membrane protein YgcG